jgi:hypothetical protein
MKINLYIMKKILILCLGIFLTLSIFGKNREFNPAVWDARVTNFILDELRAEGYTVLPEVVIVAYRNDQDTIRKDFRHQRGPAFLNDTLKKEFQRGEFRGRPEFGRPEFKGRSEFGRSEFRGRPEFGRPEFRGNHRNMRGREMKREDMKKMERPHLKKQITPLDPIKAPIA